MTSYAVMGAASFPMYSGEPVLHLREASTPVVSAFLISFYHQNIRLATMFSFYFFQLNEKSNQPLSPTENNYCLQE